MQVLYKNNPKADYYKKPAPLPPKKNNDEDERH